MNRTVLGALVAVLAASVVQAGTPLGFTGKSGNDAVRAFDLATGNAVGDDIDLLPEGNYPYDASINPAGTELWITGAVGDGVIVIDTANLVITQRIDLAGEAEYPVDVVFDSCGGDRAFVASRDHGLVAIVDTSTYAVVDTVAMPGVIDAGKMAFSARRNTLYVVDWFDDFLVSIDLDTLTPTAVDLGTSFWDLAISPDEATLYINDRGTDEVRVVDLDTMTVTANVAAGDDPWGIDITPDGATVVVANEDDSTVTVFDTATLTPQTVNLDATADPRDVEISPTGTLAYVPSGDLVGNDAIYVIDIATASVVDTIDVGESNTNVVAVRPQPGGCEIFGDGFESGDTSAWSTTVP